MDCIPYANILINTFEIETDNDRYHNIEMKDEAALEEFSSIMNESYRARYGSRAANL